MQQKHLQLKQRLAIQPLAVVCLCAIGLTACASDEKITTSPWLQDKPQIHADIQAVQHEQQTSANALQQQAVTIEAIQQQIEVLERINKQQLIHMDALNNQIEQLHQPKKQQKRATKNNKSIVAKVKKTPPVSRAKARPIPTPASIIPKVDQVALAEAEKNAYTAAYLALKSGRFDEASNAFNQQLDSYPNGEYADQAWYWLGETRFAQGLNDKARNAFKYVADHYSNSVKHAASLLKLGQIAQSQKQYSTAIEFYQQLIHMHPDSSLAEQARAALTNLPVKPEMTSSPATSENPQ